MVITLSQQQHDALQRFCELHSVKKLLFFGSVLTPTFHSGSDIDVLLEFQEGKSPGFAFFTMQEELESILGRPVDLTTTGGLHPMIKDRVLASAEAYYEHS